MPESPSELARRGREIIGALEAICLSLQAEAEPDNLHGYKLAIEWGFRSAEKGWNLQKTIQEFQVMIMERRR
jgi:hypothetical protein